MGIKKKIDIQIANPAGNITVFVRTRAERDDYTKIATQILEQFKEAEQVAFIKEKPSSIDAFGRMEMSGLEFCGNASRTFALLMAQDNGLKGELKIPVEVSGIDEILNVTVNTETNFTRIKMPNPLSVIDYEYEGIKSKAVDFGGIFHVILKNIDLDMNLFEKIRDDVNQKFNPPAMGVMFWDENNRKLKPVVYVKDIDTTYLEGSCGSGTTALSCAMGLERADGEHHFTVMQPAGTIDSSVVIEDGKVKEVFIEGPVSLSNVIETEIEI